MMTTTTMTMKKTILFFVVFSLIIDKYAADCYDSQSPTSSNYEFMLPMKQVVSCPTFASFKFACPANHVLSIEELYFSPVSISSYGQCTLDHAYACRDKHVAYEHARSECSGNQSCSLISYQLRSKTTCTFHHVISIYYKCVPTWEVTEVPIKCDICKNVTINIYQDMFGFIHSAWYPNLYPRLACHSLIKNRPDHFILIYSVTGSLGLDRIIFESVSHAEASYGGMSGSQLSKQILTGNLTTQLVFISEYDVRINLLAEDTYYFEQRKFLLYFYLVPKCMVVSCANKTSNNYPVSTSTSSTSSSSSSTYASPVYQPSGMINLMTSRSSLDHFMTITSFPPTEANIIVASSSHSGYNQGVGPYGNPYPNPPAPSYPTPQPPPPPNPYPSNSQPSYPIPNPPSAYQPVNPVNSPYQPPPPPSPPPAVYPTAPSSPSYHPTYSHDQVTYAPPLRGDEHKKPATLSDALLAAILALIYALLMIIAVLIAFYCRRRRRRLVQEGGNKIIYSQSTISSTHIVDPLHLNHHHLGGCSGTASVMPISSCSHHHLHHYRDQSMGDATSNYAGIYSSVMNRSKEDSCRVSLPQPVHTVPASSLAFRQQQQIGSAASYSHLTNEFDNYSQLAGSGYNHNYDGDLVYNTEANSNTQAVNAHTTVTTAINSNSRHTYSEHSGCGGYDQQDHHINNSMLSQEDFMALEDKVSLSSSCSRGYTTRLRENEVQEMSMYVDNGNGVGDTPSHAVCLVETGGDAAATVLKHSNNTILIHKNLD